MGTYFLVGLACFAAGTAFGAWGMRRVIIEGGRLAAAIEEVCKFATPF